MSAAIAPIRETLNAADRDLGDGDTGMTVEQIVAVWQGAAAELPEGDVGEALRMLGRATRRASGSSLAAVVAIGLAAASKRAAAEPVLDRAALAEALEAAAGAIAERSGAVAGDKSVLDSVLAIAAALKAERDTNVLSTAVAAAARAIEDFRGRPCRVGRARMYGERSIGRDDPGMLAVLLLLRAVRD